MSQCDYEEWSVDRTGTREIFRCTASASKWFLNPISKVVFCRCDEHGGRGLSGMLPELTEAEAFVAEVMSS